MENKDKAKFKETCVDYPYIPTIFPKVSRIIALGDLHGDFDFMIKLLKLSKVIDDSNKWIGGDTFVIQVGDQLDDCRTAGGFNKCGDEYGPSNPHADIEIIFFLKDLNDQAMRSGGRVIMLYGNHEILNIIGQPQHLTFKSINAFNGYVDPKNETLIFRDPLDARKYAFSNGNEYARLLACTHKAVVIIGSNMFMHAGLIPEIAEKLNINNREDLYNFDIVVREWVLGLVKKIDLIALNEFGPFWYRKYGKIQKDLPLDDEKCSEFASIMKLFKINNMILGHTPQNGITSTCGNHLHRIDTAGSRSFDVFIENGQSKRAPQAIEIKDDKILKILK